MALSKLVMYDNYFRALLKPCKAKALKKWQLSELVMYGNCPSTLFKQTM